MSVRPRRLGCRPTARPTRRKSARPTSRSRRDHGRRRVTDLNRDDRPSASAYSVRSPGSRDAFVERGPHEAGAVHRLYVAGSVDDGLRHEAEVIARRMSASSSSMTPGGRRRWTTSAPSLSRQQRRAIEPKKGSGAADRHLWGSPPALTGGLQGTPPACEVVRQLRSRPTRRASRSEKRARGAAP